MANLELSDPVLDGLEAKLGGRFQDRRLFRQALVHRSLANEAGLRDAETNERLEFLGDAVLGLVAAEVLYERFPERPEGELSTARAALVNLTTLARFARTLELGRYLQLGHGEDLSGGRQRTSSLGRAYEAVVGALYLDRGMPAVVAILRPNFVSELERHGLRGPRKDFKSLLQERLQAERGVTPDYRLIRDTGPDHAKEFRMAVFAGDQILGEGAGSSKQRAEQDAARNAVSNLPEMRPRPDVPSPD
ncbi:MAG: ribonuclease III [Actinobacteria bacterium]|nr:ribonuclease III [Actinomycetota bacterium]